MPPAGNRCGASEKETKLSCVRTLDEFFKFVVGLGRPVLNDSLLPAAYEKIRHFAELIAYAAAPGYGLAVYQQVVTRLIEPGEPYALHPVLPGAVAEKLLSPPPGEDLLERLRSAALAEEI